MSASLVSRLFLLFCCTCAWSCKGAERQDQVLADGWKFIRDNVALDALATSWPSVTIPHTWNTKDADAKIPHDKNGYYRGACWYDRVLDVPKAWQGRRVFLRFEAVSLVAKVYLNGQLLGEHCGGFTAFCYELTPALRFGAINDLRVQVDNSPREDVPPISGDFNIDGGIYRPVHLIVADPVCISPLDMASSGVYETIRSLTDAKAQVEVKTLISNGNESAATARIQTQVTDEKGEIVATDMREVSIPGKQTVPAVATLAIENPHRWDGRHDPYLYTTKVSVQTDGGTGDAIVQPLGLRTVEINEEKGFLLNDKPYAIHGVNRHQDWGDQGWAATAQNDDQDMQIMLDMGVTAIRLAHYPQSEYWHDLCDRNGLLLWNEVSLVNEIRDTPNFRANAEQQLRELILQRYNHPSVAFWGIFNELRTMPKGKPSAANAGPPDDKLAQQQAEVDLLNHLKSVIHELDSSRLIVGATCVLNRPCNQVPEHLCFNFYPGWYNHDVGRMTSQIDKYYHEFGRRVGISEYGAGANITQHEETLQPVLKTGGPFHPEEWQTHVHEQDWAAIRDNPHVWGSFIWCMFDFQVATRHEGGQPSLNDKGLVTQDRQTKKDAYFFYQANWATQPMVHIAARRMTPRHEAMTEVQIFSNCEEVTLSVNGKVLGTQAPDNSKVARWPGIQLQSGSNKIEVTAKEGQKMVHDNCEWTLNTDPVGQP